jgi:hypothetical protein
VVRVQGDVLCRESVYTALTYAVPSLELVIFVNQGIRRDSSTASHWPRGSSVNAVKRARGASLATPKGFSRKQHTTTAANDKANRSIDDYTYNNSSLSLPPLSTDCIRVP